MALGLLYATINFDLIIYSSCCLRLRFDSFITCMGALILISEANIVGFLLCNCDRISCAFLSLFCLDDDGVDVLEETKDGFLWPVVGTLFFVVDRFVDELTPNSNVTRGLFFFAVSTENDPPPPPDIPNALARCDEDDGEEERGLFFLRVRRFLLPLVIVLEVFFSRDDNPAFKTSASNSSSSLSASGSENKSPPPQESSSSPPASSSKSNATS